jgi:HSP20 family protein
MEEFWREPFGSFPSFPFLKDQGYPALDISESDSEIVVKAELPGLESKDVEITVDEDILSIRGEKKFEEEEKKDNYHRIERSYGSFQRSVVLPCSVTTDQVRAKFDKGVLTISMAKSAKEKGQKIKIES